MVDETGPDQLTFNALADRLGVSPGAIYHHVGDAAGLRSAVAADSTRELGARVTEATVGLSGSAAIEAVVDGWRAWATEHPRRYELASGSAASGSEEVVEAGRTLITVLARVLERAGCAPEDATHAARFLRSAIHGFVMLEISGGFVLDADVDASFDHMRERLSHGLVDA